MSNKMGTIMILCPNTLKPVSTTYEMDEKGWATCTLENNSNKCSVCGEMHSWSKADAFFEPER
jgi:hypothetical protein